MKDRCRLFLLQEELRAHPGRMLVAIDEILRIHRPPISIRITTRAIDICGEQIPAGSRIKGMI